jgi:hypothetical protein
MKRILFAAVVVGVFAVCAPAYATDAHWTDGTTYQGTTDYGPPPVAAQWKTPCDVLLIDPPVFTYVTVHASEGGSEYGSVVVPYDAVPPALLEAQVHPLVDGHKGTITLTWNIGTGVSAPFEFDCTPPPTTTTSDPRVCMIPEGCTTTTTLADSNATSTTFDIGTAITATSVPPIAPAELPRTGDTPWPLVILGCGAIACGLMAAFWFGAGHGAGRGR